MTTPPPREEGPAQPWPRHIVFLDEQHARPAHPYTPEGEIRMMGDLASALHRRGGMRPVAVVLLAIVLLPVVLSALILIL